MLTLFAPTGAHSVRTLFVPRARARARAYTRTHYKARAASEQVGEPKGVRTYRGPSDSEHL